MVATSLPEILVNDTTAGVTIVNDDPTLSVLWDQAVQAAVIETKVGPTIASRAYAIVHTAIFEAWAAFDDTAVGTATGDLLQVGSAEMTFENKSTAMSYAAYTALVQLFPEQKDIADALMDALSLSTDITEIATDPHAVRGGIAGLAVLFDAADDGSFQANGYVDPNEDYAPVNTSPDDITDIAAWTPEHVPIDDPNGPLQQFLTPHWGGVEPFALGDEDPLSDNLPDDFFNGVEAHIDAAAGTLTITGLSDDATEADFKAIRKFLRKNDTGLSDEETGQMIRDLRADLFDGDDVPWRIARHDTNSEWTIDLNHSVVGPIINDHFADLAADLIDPDLDALGRDAFFPPEPEPFFADAVHGSIDVEAGTITLEGMSDTATLGDFRALRDFLKTTDTGLSRKETKELIRDLQADLYDETPDRFAAFDIDRTVTLDVSKDMIGPIINEGFISQAEALIEISADLDIEGKKIAEFWEDGGGTAFPPGTWMSFSQFVSARDDHDIDDDAQLFFMMGNAVFDAGIATWDAKEIYDYARPVRAIRELGELGLIGEFGTDHLGNEGFVIEAYAGDGLNTQKILASNFITYQNPLADASPPFAEYTSGHSSFSAAGAKVLEMFTGSKAFGGSVDIDFLLFEATEPSVVTTLQWDTFAEAADEAGFSRIYGGIHFDDGDLNGRALGDAVGEAAFDEAMTYINGTADAFLFG